MTTVSRHKNAAASVKAGTPTKLLRGNAIAATYYLRLFGKSCPELPDFFRVSGDLVRCFQIER